MHAPTQAHGGTDAAECGSTAPSLSPRTWPCLHLAARMAAALAAPPLHMYAAARIELAHHAGYTKLQTAGAMKMKVLVVLLLLSVCSSPALAWQTDPGSGSGRPYHYGEESFRHWTTRSRQGRFRVLERFAHELLEDAVGSYRVAELEAAPRAFLQPSHYDADEVMFVKEGEGVVVLLRGGRRESFCVREGDVMAIPAGAVVYSANTHHSEWFRVVMLLSAVSTSGRFEEFFPIVGESPESFLGVFSDDVIQASFNTRREEWEKVFEKQSKGEITTASEEQIRELSRSCSRGGREEGGDGDSGSPRSSPSKWEIKPSSLTGKRPTHSNSHGRHYEITGDECPHLRVLDMKVGLANISRGSMLALSYNTRAHKIAFVVDGGEEGYFEMACPHVVSGGGREREHGRRGEWGREEEEEEQGGRGHKSRSYRQVKSRIREGSVIVIPAGHPTALVAGEDKNLAVLCFEVNANFDEKVFLAGTNSALRQMDGPAKLLAFAADEEEEVDRVIGAQKDDVFLRGPQSRRVSSA